MGEYFENNDQFLNTLKTVRKQKKDGAVRVGIFGSRARKTHRPTSDIDIISESPNASTLGLQESHEGDIHIIRSHPDTDSSGMRLIRNTTRWLFKKKT